MSSDETQAALARAYELVESGKYDDARAILDPILAADKNNADAWWVYAHAVTNADDGRDALENVVRIDPSYPGAADLLTQARAVAEPPKPKITPLGTPPATMPEAPSHLPEAGGVGEPESAGAARAASTTTQRSLPLVPIIAVIIVIVLIAVLLLSQTRVGSVITPTPNQVAVVGAAPTQSIAGVVTPEAIAATELPTVTALVVTEQVAGGVATPEASAQAAADSFAQIETALAQFPIAESGVGEVQTSLGNTLQVTVCTTAGRAMRTLLPQVMNALAKQSSSLAADVQAISARMVDCGQNTQLLAVAVDTPTAQSYALGKLNDADFAATWKPQ